MRPAHARAADHYDRVTQVWRQYVMGEELHFGLFQGAQEPLPEATLRLTRTLMDVAVCDVPGLRVWDAGCGLGTVALRLAQERGCQVVGCTTSPYGLGLARARAKEAGLEGRVRFDQADMSETGAEPDASFDRVFCLEALHLVEDKEAFFREAYRLLRPGGRLGLCDVCKVGTQARAIPYVVLGHSPEAAVRMQQAVDAVLHRTFGSSQTADAATYVQAARAAGFMEVTLEDLSVQTRPTLEHWARRAAQSAAEIREALGQSYLDDLFLSLLHMSYGWGQTGGGYLMLSARKPA